MKLSSKSTKSILKFTFISILLTNCAIYENNNVSKQQYEISKVEINPDNIHTNLVRFKVPENTGFEVAEKLKEMGILINGSYTDLRMVAHYGIDNKHIDKTIESMSKVMNSI